MKWYLRVLKKYANFGGRARRKEYWMFILFHVLIILVLGAADIALQFSRDELYLLPIYTMMTLIPHAAVTVRRLHDIGKNAWWLLLAIIPTVLSWLLLLVLTSPMSLVEEMAPQTISPATELLIRFIPAIGGIWMLIYMVMEGNWEANEYGEDPKKEPQDEVKEYEAAYSNYERYKNNVISFSIIAGVIGVFSNTLFRYLVSSGTLDYLTYKPVFFIQGLLFATVPLLLCFLIKKPTLRTMLIILALIEMALSLYGTFEMMK